MKKRIYLAGPMSGLPQFNFPTFYRVGSLLREAGWDVVSPAELDDADTAAAALKSVDGKPQDAHRSWGDFLARDVKVLADGGIQGIVFLPDWQKSRGARLEASVGLLCGFTYYGQWEYRIQDCSEDCRRMTSKELAAKLFFANLQGEDLLA